MEIKINVRDDAPMGKALEGSIKLISPTEAVFTEWKRSVRSASTQKKRVFKKLIHGRVSASEDDVRLTLCIDRHETRIDDETLTQVLEFDCSEACATTEIWEEEGGILNDSLRYDNDDDDKGYKRVNPWNK